MDTNVFKYIEILSKMWWNEGPVHCRLNFVHKSSIKWGHHPLELCNVFIDSTSPRIIHNLWKRKSEIKNWIAKSFCKCVQYLPMDQSDLWFLLGMEQRYSKENIILFACYQRKLDTFLNSQDMNSKGFVSADMIMVAQDYTEDLYFYVVIK